MNIQQATQYKKNVAIINKMNRKQSSIRLKYIIRVGYENKKFSKFTYTFRFSKISEARNKAENLMQVLFRKKDKLTLPGGNVSIITYIFKIESSIGIEKPIERLRQFSNGNVSRKKI